MSKAMSLIPQGSIGAYVQKVNRYPKLSAEEEKELAESLFYDGNLEAAKKLVMSNLRFVAYVAKGYSGYGLPIADLIQEGNVGLMKAVKRFDPTVGVRLVSFAVHWIKAEIHEYVLRNWRLVKVATTKAQRKLFFNLRKAKKRLGWLTNDEVSTVADELNVSTQDVLEMESRLNAQDQSFDLSSNDDDDNNFAPVQYLEDKSSDVSVIVEEENNSINDKTKLYSSLAKLDSRSQDILNSRWLNEPKATLHDLAKRYSISPERVRQLENNALKKIKLNMDLNS